MISFVKKKLTKAMAFMIAILMVSSVTTPIEVSAEQETEGIVASSAVDLPTYWNRPALGLYYVYNVSRWDILPFGGMGYRLISWPTRWAGVLNPFQPADTLILNVTSDIRAGILDTDLTIPSNRNVVIRSCPTALRDQNREDRPFVITMDGTMRHFTVNNGATLTLENIILCGGHGDNFLSFNNGGGVRVNSAMIGSGRGNLFMAEGGVIRNSRANNGGGVRLVGGILTMMGGTIENNGARDQGGGVSAEGGAIVRFGSGIVRNNQVQPNWVLGFHQPDNGFGGGLYIFESDMHMRGGEIYGNLAYFGGGISVRGTGVLSGGSITSSPGRLDMHGGVIRNNRAPRSSQTVPNQGGQGGGVRVCREGIFYLHGGEIRNNGATTAGGGVSIGFNSLMYGATDIHSRPGIMRQFGGTIHNNTAQDGGGVRVGGGRTIMGVAGTPGLFFMYGGVIEHNEATRNGGGIWVQNNCRLFVGFSYGGYSALGTDHTHVRHNTARQDGGGIWVDINMCLRIDQVNINNNHAGRNGGGMRISRYEYRAMLSNNAYRLGSASTMIFTPNVAFANNSAGGGAWHPPVNAAEFGGGRIPVTVSRTNDIWHPLNNFDINFRGTALIDRPWTPPDDPCICCPPDCDYDHDCEPCICDECDCWPTDCCPPDQEFTITFHLYINSVSHNDLYERFRDYATTTSNGFRAIEVLVTPGSLITEWPDQGLLNRALVDVRNIYGTETVVGHAFWGWFDDATLNPARTGRELNATSGLRRPALADRCLVDYLELLERIEAADTDTAVIELFGTTEGGNIDLYAIWSLWGDVDDDDEVTGSDVLLMDQYLFDRFMVSIDGEPYFNEPLNTRAGRVTTGPELTGDDVLRVDEYLFDRFMVSLDGEPYFGAVLGRP